MATITAATVEEAAARRFLRHRRVAVVGASPERGNFGAAVVRALRQHGTDVVVVHPSGRAVDDAPGRTDLASVEGDLDGVIVMVPAGAAAEVVGDCIARGVRSIWLFRGIGGPGAVSDEALALCAEHGVEVIPGACPLMFLPRAGWPHRVHRFVRRRRS